ncbi:hypothetical protein ES703_123041 [subsurface metagenome]
MKSKVVFIDKELENVFDGLDDNDPIKKALIRAIENIREDPRVGRIVKKRLIPEKLIKKYGIDNLRIYNLPSVWRMLYTITAGEIEIISVILGLEEILKGFQILGFCWMFVFRHPNFPDFYFPSNAEILGFKSKNLNNAKYLFFYEN